MFTSGQHQNILHSSHLSLIRIFTFHDLARTKWTQYPALNKILTTGNIIKDLLSTWNMKLILKQFVLSIETFL